MCGKQYCPQNRRRTQRHKGVPGELSAFGVLLVYLVRKYPEEAETGCGVLMELSCCHRGHRVGQLNPGMFLERAQVSVVLPLNSYAVNHQLVPNMGALVIWFFIYFLRPSPQI